MGEHTRDLLYGADLGLGLGFLQLSSCCSMRSQAEDSQDDGTKPSRDESVGRGFRCKTEVGYDDYDGVLEVRW